MDRGFADEFELVAGVGEALGECRGALAGGVFDLGGLVGVDEERLDLPAGRWRYIPERANPLLHTAGDWDLLSREDSGRFWP